MKNIYYDKVRLTNGFIADRVRMNEDITINAVYDRFYDTGRISAFDFKWREGDDKKPHIFWDSDCAKWMEGALYILKYKDDPTLLSRVESLVERIKENQCEDGYFNIFFTVCEPEKRFTDRSKHELYCAGHLMEAAVAYSEVTGRTDFLDCMEKYADLIHRVFVIEGSAEFDTPGHEEIEYALIRMYRHTGKRKFLELAKYFLEVRGSEKDRNRASYNQSHLPVRQQKSAVGHSVRALYLYTAMAAYARETGDESMLEACKTLYDDVMTKMYVTGGVGSTRHGEAFTVPFDLPNDSAYTETCAGIALAMFANEMLEITGEAKYADTVERALYNGILSGVSLDGKSFFYENPLEINLAERYKLDWAEIRRPITQRVECFSCSCCPPNINRFLGSLSKYFYGIDGDTLYINQFAGSTLECDGVSCIVETNYPVDGEVKITAKGIGRLAVRIPAWCTGVKISRDSIMENGYAIIKNDGTPVTVKFDIKPTAVYADPRVIRDAGKLCVMRGPVVYCAEGVDNGSNLHAIKLSDKLEFTECYDEKYGLMTLTVKGTRSKSFDSGIYACTAPLTEEVTVKLIPYNAFANRGECDMAVWLRF